MKFGESIEDLQTCRLLIKQYIPAGLFVDPYELASLRERNITEVQLLRGFLQILEHYFERNFLRDAIIWIRQNSM